jgi:hypothetical protein
MLIRLRGIWSRHKLLISTIIGFAVLAFGVLLIAGRSSKPAQAAPRPLDVEVVQVEQRDVPIYSEWIGTTDGMVNAEIKAQVTGYLLRQDYQEGSFVKKGQLLFELDSRPLSCRGRSSERSGCAVSGTTRTGQFAGQPGRSSSGASEQPVTTSAGSIGPGSG